MKFFTLSSIIHKQEIGIIKRLLVYGSNDDNFTVYNALMRFAQIFGTDSYNNIIIQEGIALDERLMQLVSSDTKNILKDFVKNDGVNYEKLEYFTQLQYKHNGE